ncbi:MAG: FAD-dependent oxidoreductase [Leptospiraceae bacterium]|nr:FAD-dependent oxidoreductase [Leptospiraceae bacterium]
MIGSGYGGVASASLLQDSGLNTLILEAHDLPFGCASYFNRKEFQFDVGATTFSGVLDHQPIGRLRKRLGLEFELKKLDPGMVIFLNSKKIIRHSNKEDWISEAESHFGENGQKKFWDSIYSIEKIAWEFLTNNSNLPPVNLKDYIKLGKITNLKYLPLLKEIFSPLSNLLKSKKIINTDFIKFINEQLLITTQSTIEDAPVLSSALGLSYPSETYYPIGGMYRPGEKILNKFIEKGGDIKFKQKVLSIKRNKDFYELETNNSKYRSKYLISNSPIWSLQNITEGKIQKYFKKLSEKFNYAPAAFIMNFAIKSNIDLETLYYQVHTKIKIPHCSAGAFFVSFSSKEDRLKAPEGYRTVTISTHTKPEFWNRKNREIYKEKKRDTSEFILKEFFNVFPFFQESEILYLLPGSSETYERYTGRYKGFVGGIPHRVSPSLLSFPANETPFKNFYIVGDSSFPGQGIPAVVYGGMNVADRILEKI